MKLRECSACGSAWFTTRSNGIHRGAFSLTEENEVAVWSGIVVCLACAVPLEQQPRGMVE